MINANAKKKIEEVFVTEGSPQDTYVDPPNYHQIFVDIRNPRKPVIVEGQSGTGKTTTVKKILDRLSNEAKFTYLTARKASDVSRIAALISKPESGIFVIDDLHRLPEATQRGLSDIAKISAEEADESPLPKLVLVGINQVGAGLIQYTPDLAKRLGVHRIRPATEDIVAQLIAIGSELLNIEFDKPTVIYEESRGDYWLTQQLCQYACLSQGIYETQDKKAIVTINTAALRSFLVEKLSNAYGPAVQDFCRGRRFRPSNVTYFNLLHAVSRQNDSNVDLTVLANSFPEIAPSINGIKDRRLPVLLDEKPKASQYFFYNAETKQFAIEDPALFYYLRHLDWTKLRTDCGFKADAEKYCEFDVAISYAGENRALAEHIAAQLELLDVRVFFDRNYEANYMGKVWSKEFERIFGTDSRFVVCLLDQHHKEKVWPTFEREVFSTRVPTGEVIPIFLDDSTFPGIPKDLIGAKLHIDLTDDNWTSQVDKEVVYKLIDRIG